MNYTTNPAMVRADVFRSEGKWYETVELDMSQAYDDVFLYDRVLSEFQSQIGGHHNMWLVVLDPYHKNAYPVMVLIP